MGTKSVLVLGWLLAAGLCACGGSTVVSAQGAGGATGTSSAGGAGGAKGTGGAGGTTPTFTACNVSADCELVATSCCEPCGLAQLTDYTAIATAKDMAWNEVHCANSTTTCLGCATQKNPALGVACEAGACTGFDAAAFAACSTADDCTMRLGVGCCEDCNADPIAMNKTGAAKIEGWVCDQHPSCATCPADPNKKYAMACQQGACKVLLAP